MEGPAFLPVGTEVSAKYRGAFCEAKVKKIVRAIKIKVNLKETGLPLVVTDEDVKGTLKVGCSVEVKHPESGHYVDATINKITDQSMYTVVFDDGDENTLRRTQLCLKGEKHFVKTDTLDELPLTNPEHFGTPVLKGGKKKRRSANTSNLVSDSESDTSSDDPPRRYWGKLKDMVGKVYCMQQDDRKKSMTVPVLVGQPNADETILKTREHLLVKSFKDSKFYSVPRKELKEFTRETAMKNDDKALKSVYEKALLYFDARELPQNWDREEILGADSEDEDDDDQSSDDEPSEEKDMFVAQLYKFMDDRGTPINKGPVVGTRDLNLHRLFRVVQKLGGYNRVTNQMKWRFVYSKMGLPNTATAANQIKTAYKKYLHAFEDFYRKLGSSMGTITRPSRSRHSSGRNIPGFRDRGERSESSPKSPRSSSSIPKKSPKDDITEENVEDVKSQDPKTSKGLREETSKEEFSDTDSPSKRRTRTSIEERVKIPRELKKSPPKEDQVIVEKEEAKLKKRPIRKKPLTPKPEDSDEPKKIVVTKDEIEDVEESDEEEDDDDDDAKSHKTTASEELNSKKYEQAEYPPGSRLKVKYGKGKNIKLYEAKVLDCESDGNMHYLVHYNGWNVRYDEWVKKDRIVDCIYKSDGKKALTSNRPTLPGTKLQTLKKKTIQISKAKPTTPKEEKEEMPFPKEKEEKPKISKPVTKASKAPRPTRSTSLENKLASGLSPRKRPRRNSGYTETSDSKSRMSDEDSSGSESDEVEDDTGGGPSVGPDSPENTIDAATASNCPSDKELEKLQMGPDTRESAFDIIKELQADMDFDKASQDSLERDLNIKVPDMAKMSKNDSDEDMDLADILSCLNKGDEYKFPSSENESVKSEGPEKKIIRGKTKTKGELKAKPDLSKFTKVETPKKTEPNKSKQDLPKVKPETAKSKADIVKPKSDSAKSKTESPKSKVEMPRLEIAKLKSDVVKTKEVVTVKTKNETTKAKSEIPSVKVKPEPTKGKLPETVKTKAELKSNPTPEKDIKEIKIDETEPPVLVSKDTPKDEDSENVKNDNILSSGDEQNITAEKPTRGRPKKENKDSSDAEKEEKSIVETPTKTRGRGRGKRKVDKEEIIDSEDEPLKKKSRKKIKKTVTDEEDKLEPPKLSSASGDEMSKDEACEQSSQESSDWVNAPELTLTPKLNIEDIPKDSDIPDEPAPPLSPVHNMEGTSTSSQPDLNSFDLRGAMESSLQQPQSLSQLEDTVKPSVSAVENTPPQTPEHVSANQTPHHDPIYEICSTRSEMEANLEVEKFLQGARPPGEDSPSVYDPSNVSTASDESVGQDKTLDNDLLQSTSAVKRKSQPEDTAAVAPKRKRGNKKVSLKSRHEQKRGFSDYEDEDSKDALPTTSKLVQASSSGSYPALMKPPEIPRGIPKYDFVQQLDEAKYLEREQRVNFLFSKISDLRTVYMQLKAEVASIDRKRKRFKKKQRLAQEAAAECLIGLEQSVL